MTMPFSRCETQETNLDLISKFYALQEIFVSFMIYLIAGMLKYFSFLYGAAVLKVLWFVVTAMKLLAMSLMGKWSIFWDYEALIHIKCYFSILLTLSGLDLPAHFSLEF